MLPDLLGQSLESIQRGELKVRFDVQHLDQLVAQLTRASHTLAGGIIIAGLIVGSSLIVRETTGPMATLGFVGYAVALVLGLWLLGEHPAGCVSERAGGRSRGEPGSTRPSSHRENRDGLASVDVDACLVAGEHRHRLDGPADRALLPEPAGLGANVDFLIHDTDVDASGSGRQARPDLGANPPFEQQVRD